MKKLGKRVIFVLTIMLVSLPIAMVLDIKEYFTEPMYPIFCLFGALVISFLVFRKRNPKVKLLMTLVLIIPVFDLFILLLFIAAIIAFTIVKPSGFY